MSRWITLSEVRLGLRLIAKQPILSITIVLALATGIGLATIGFTLREAILNGQLPFANGDRFVRLVLHSEADDNVQLDLAAYHAIRDTSKSFVHVGAVGDAEYALEGNDGTVQAIRIGLITPRSFQFLPAVPLVGRVLTVEDGAPGAAAVVLVRESLWRGRFGARASIVGESIRLSGVTRTVVGILPDTFRFPSSGEIWVPLDEATLGGRAGTSGASELTVFGVLRDGLEKDGATAELSAYSRPERQGAPGTATSVLALPFTGDDGTTNVVMSGVVAVLVLVLLVAASNIASLVSARTWSRSSELAVRTALGARRSRVVGQLFVEVAILSAIASVIGLVLAQGALNYIVGLMGSDIPFWMTFDPTIRTMAFVVAVTLLVSVVSGLVPALKVTSVNLNGVLHAGGRGSAAGGFGSVGRVLMIEVAISVALLNCALVTSRALASYIDDIPALPKGQVLTAQLSGEQSKDTRERLLTSIRALPGVIAAGGASHLPRLDPSAVPIVIEPLDGQSQALAGSTPATEVSDGFLESIGGRPMAGRSFSANDFLDGAAAVVIVNQPFAERFFDGSPIGRRVKVSTQQWREIIGVVPDLGMSAGDRRSAAGVYVPLPDRTQFLHLAIRAAGNPNTTAGPLRRIVAEVDPKADLRGIRLLEEVGVEQRSFLSGLASAMTALGVMTLLLSVVSIYALLSFMVTRRTREIGIRVALGARQSQVLATVAGSAFAYVGAGTAIGTIAGVMLAGFQSVMLIRMPEAGVATPTIVIGALALSSLAAAWVPTRRALGIRPSEALASE
jgi:putative ABC transport system permease protein